MSRGLAVILVLLPAVAVLAAESIDGELLVDPTQPLFYDSIGVTPQQPQIRDLFSLLPVSFEVSFVRASSTSPMAVVNDQRVTIGDVISGATVVAIDRNGVILSIGGEERRISVFDTELKTPAFGSN